MDDEIERLVVSVRADTGAFASDVAAMKSELDGPFAEGVGRAGQMIETSLSRAIRSGKLGFDDLKRMAVSALAEIAASALRTSLSPSGGSGGGGSLLGSLFGAVGSLFGLPGRATGGPVTGGQAYMVGERGPELFVPTASGRVEKLGGGSARAVNITVNVSPSGDAGRPEMVKSGQQVARAVRRALERAEG